MLGRSDWVPAFVDWLEHDPARLSELALDQKQALAAHPNRDIAARAKKLLASGGGLPDRDRQLVIDRLAPELEQGGDPARGKLVFQQQCAKCHRHNGEGGQVGPDLSGMAAIPRHELVIHILDPSRSVEGNFVQYTVATTDGRVISGLLASESNTSVELIDAEGKRHAILREDIDQMAASKKSLMPEGFEKQVPPAGLNDLLAFLTQRGKYRPLDLSKAATIVSTRGMFEDADAEHERLVFRDWSPKIVDGVPFVLVDPKGDKVPNVVLLHGPQGKFPPLMPRSVELACNSSAKAIHFLSGVSGWGFPFGRKGSVSLTVRLHYADGKVEDHRLENGVQFADYIRVVDVPGSKLAFKLGGQQIRYFRIEPRRKDPIERIELVKGPDATAPVVMAVTVEATGGIELENGDSPACQMPRTSRKHDRWWEPVMKQSKPAAVLCNPWSYGSVRMARRLNETDSPIDRSRPTAPLLGSVTDAEQFRDDPWSGRTVSSRRRAIPGVRRSRSSAGRGAGQARAGLQGSRSRRTGFITTSVSGIATTWPAARREFIVVDAEHGYAAAGLRPPEAGGRPVEGGRRRSLQGRQASFREHRVRRRRQIDSV